MRRTDDETILRMKAEGRTGREIAKFFGVSPAYISKRLKRLQPPPESFEKLTDKQKRFVLAVAEGKSNAEAARVAFDVSHDNSAKAIGYATKKDPDVKKAIGDILREEGLSRRYLVRKLKDVVDSRDGHVSARGIDMASKMLDLYPKEEKQAPQIFIKADQLKLIHQTLLEMGEREAAERMLVDLMERPETDD